MISQKIEAPEPPAEDASEPSEGSVEPVPETTSEKSKTDSDEPNA